MMIATKLLIFFNKMVIKLLYNYYDEMILSYLLNQITATINY
jgi:hypothetical protein